ncbi:hypothetical protein M0R45_025493 [Rubus argutus]|uniref:Uncharacterized protein n=1 Tax=Rubus argutus TaxID=59490 RepID=A0AAW1WWF4_RUBAR
MLFSFGWWRNDFELWLFATSDVGEIYWECSDLDNLDRGRWLGMGFWWTSALVLIWDGCDIRWEIVVGDCLGRGGDLGLGMVVAEEVGKGGRVGFGLVLIRTSVGESFGAG